MKINTTSQNLYNVTKKMEWNCKYLSNRMLTRNEQNKYSNKYKILKENFKTDLAEINDLINQLEVEKETVLPTVWCKPNVWNNDCTDELYFFQ